MATYIREETAPIIPNTTMKKVIRVEDNTHVRYEITPSDGYVMHDSGYDAPEVDENYEETGNIILGYRPTTAAVTASYDFTPAEMQDEAGNTVTAYGARQFYCKLATDVPADQIFGVTDTPEIM